ncbi:hypothetical protein QBC34DRAFT_51707 [Podospora aff. communis PSN243]|uniref:F-box domain-containing protein n=1 Tax=Podospora aff. communis PSN243 TaxID=3040156 RepID=A0AAV9GTQ1_9PEZI|nr:hypothetical protein QBC34DRAFT_51707 [Podospora aff. communis PSN243]
MASPLASASAPAPGEIGVQEKPHEVPHPEAQAGAPAETTVGLACLPGEILLHIVSYLEPIDTISLQLVSRAFRTIARDDSLWRSHCFENSSFLEAIDRRRVLEVSRRAGAAFFNDSNLHGSHDGEDLLATAVISPLEDPNPRRHDRKRIMANWDPSFPEERISWYDEYIQRHGPISVNWMQLPRVENQPQGHFVEARGVALYRPDKNGKDPNSPETLFAVSPLDNGAVCLWDVNGTKGRRGAIIAKSRPGILFIDGPNADNSRRCKRVDSGVTECVSVDSELHRAFFAVQSHLITVDLQRLAVIDCESFPWSITALSGANPGIPLTVGTSLGIHLHDYRSRVPIRSDEPERVDDIGQMGARLRQRNLQLIFDDEPLAPYAPLSQPGPLSILHLERPGQRVELSDDIYVAGRFSNILHYDRRKFPSIKGSIHSGASLCSMASLPYPFSTFSSELRRMGELSVDKIEKSKSASGGRTLVAVGEYNTKGSLEIYGLLPAASTNPERAGGLQSSILKNRQTASRSKLLSVVNHGTRLAVSDGSGELKWFERDGFTEVRRCKIGPSEVPEGHSVFASMPGSDDIARKLLPTREPMVGASGANASINNNDLLFWTGEKLGLVRISAKPGFTAQDFEEQRDELLLEGERARASEERAYSERMRLALERQADDVRFARNLGIGSGRRRS